MSLLPPLTVDPGFACVCPTLAVPVLMRSSCPDLNMCGVPRLPVLNNVRYVRQMVEGLREDMQGIKMQLKRRRSSSDVEERRENHGRRGSRGRLRSSSRRGHGSRRRRGRDRSSSSSAHAPENEDFGSEDQWSSSGEEEGARRASSRRYGGPRRRSSLSSSSPRREYYAHYPLPQPPGMVMVPHGQGHFAGGNPMSVPPGPYNQHPPGYYHYGAAPIRTTAAVAAAAAAAAAAAYPDAFPMYSAGAPVVNGGGDGGVMWDRQRYEPRRRRSGSEHSHGDHPSSDDNRGVSPRAALSGVEAGGVRGRTRVEAWKGGPEKVCAPVASLASSAAGQMEGEDGLERRKGGEDESDDEGEGARCLFAGDEGAQPRRRSDRHHDKRSRGSDVVVERLRGRSAARPAAAGGEIGAGSGSHARRESSRTRRHSEGSRYLLGGGSTGVIGGSSGGFRDEAYRGAVSPPPILCPPPTSGGVMDSRFLGTPIGPVPGGHSSYMVQHPHPHAYQEHVSRPVRYGDLSWSAGQAFHPSAPPSSRRAHSPWSHEGERVPRRRQARSPAGELDASGWSASGRRDAGGVGGPGSGSRRGREPGRRSRSESRSTSRSWEKEDSAA